MGIKILGGVDHPSKCPPGGTRIPAGKIVRNRSTLLLDVGMGGSDAVVIEMKMVTPKLVLRTILPQVGEKDDLEGTRTDLRANGLTSDITMMTT